MIKLFGTRETRLWRCEWACEEIGLEYTVDPVEWREARTVRRLLAVNPNGRVPAMQDGELCLAESLAINLHLARKYSDGTLWPADLAQQSLVLQWTMWAMTEIDRPAMGLCWQRSFYPPELRKPAAAAELEQMMQRPLGVLERTLEGRDYLVGDAFDIGDLNVASVVHWVFRYGRAARDHLPNIARWLAECEQRPAFQRARYEHEYPM